MNTQGYSSKSTAVRGAKRAGANIETLSFYADENGRWWFDSKTVETVFINDTAEVEPTEANFDADESDPLAEVISNTDFAETGEKIKGMKMPSYKQLAKDSGRKSGVDKPVGFVHQYLADNPMLTRKEAVATLVKYGVNYSTARTQYQKWFSGKK